MSRQEWFESVQRSSTDTGHRGINVGEKYSGKTGAPEAKTYDEATQLFHDGIKLARQGDDDAAAKKIATAFLLNSRCINFTTKNLTELDPTQSEWFLDFELLRRLATKMQSFAGSVLTITGAQYMGRDPLLGQSFIAMALVVIEKLLDVIEKDPSIEQPSRGILGGHLNRKILLYRRSALHMAMGNRKKAIQDQTKALRVDEFYTTARESRAFIWASMKLKDDKKIHKEFSRVIYENHKDSRSNDAIYGWLAVTTLNNPSLGSIGDAKDYYDKCLKATFRRDEIYGQQSTDKLPDILQVAHSQFRHLSSESLNFQRNLSNVNAKMRDTTVDEEESRKDKYSCVKCGARRKPDGGAVMKCTRCKSVSYCSRECQKADWKSHRHFCNNVQNIAELAGISSSSVPTTSSNTNACNDEVLQEVDSIVKRTLPPAEVLPSAKRAPGPPEVLPSYETEAYRARKSNTITPRERLICYCELYAIIRHDERGIPGESIVPGIKTPYEYWGIPSDGGSSNSIIMRCNHFQNEDFTWIVNNFDAVHPHFEMVAKMNSGFHSAIKDLVNEMDLSSQGIYTVNGIRMQFDERLRPFIH